ncbi:two-component regulator propeller domain-containing protein, partial [Bacteroidota bacterium]
IFKMLFTLALLTSLSISQNNTMFEKFSTEHGLLQNSIMHMVQDSRGFLWFCTLDGLIGHDGYQFKIFREE